MSGIVPFSTHNSLICSHVDLVVEKMGFVTVLKLGHLERKKTSSLSVSTVGRKFEKGSFLMKTTKI